VEAAREVGIDEGAVRAAARELQREGYVPPGEARALAKQKLFRHIAVWAVLSVFLLVFSIIVKGGIHRAFLIGIAAWGMAVGLQVVNYFFPDAQRSREKKRRAPPAVDETRVEAGVDALMTAAQIRARVAVPAPPRQRIADDSSEAAAEAEAERAAEEAVARRLR
jgi:hypothetical protein